MSDKKACIVVPARLQSARLPGKLLMEIGGKSVIERTVEQSIKTGLQTFVLTDSDEIRDKLAGVFAEDKCKVIVTTVPCINGTERISKHLHEIPDEFELVINVQGDEPFVSPDNILYALAKHRENGMAKDTKVFYTTLHEEETNQKIALSKASVKVVTDQHDHAVWYSRAAIPTTKVASSLHTYKLFTGIYVFNRIHLAKYHSLPDTPAQLREDVEQLKVLEHGYQILTYPTKEYNEISVNTSEDLDYLRHKYTAKPDGNTLRTGLLDCTLRDGGYINNWLWDAEAASEMLKTISPYVDYMEVGFCNNGEKYKGNPVGSMRMLTRNALRHIRAAMDPLCKVTVMVDLGSESFEALRPRNKDIDMIRIAFHKEKADAALVLGKELKELGYEVCLNFMISNRYTHDELREYISRSGDIDYIYIADSLGLMEPKDVVHMVELVQKMGKKCGVHLHNNMQRAVANYLAAKDTGALMDATIFGLGRGAGNLPLETTLPDEALLPVLSLVEKHIKPLYQSAYNCWGYDTDFFLASRMGCHPNYVSKMRDLGFPPQQRLSLLMELKGQVLFKPDLIIEKFQKHFDEELGAM